MYFHEKNMTMNHSIRLSLLCRCKWTRKSHLWYGNASEQYLLLGKNKRVYCVYTRIVSTQEILVHAQDSCTCTRFLCMHNTLVHAQHSCACTGGARDQGRDPKQNAAPGRTRGAVFWGPALVPGPSSACKRVLCMHKSVVHAQESCACTRILCIDNSILETIV